MFYKEHSKYKNAVKYLTRNNNSAYIYNDAMKRIETIETWTELSSTNSLSVYIYTRWLDIRALL